MAAKDAKTKAPEITYSKGDLFKVDFKHLHIVEGFNVRQDFGDIESLAKSIEENGVQVPFQGYREGNEFYIIDGGRRYAALTILNKRGVHVKSPFIVEPKGSNEESRILRMVLTNDGKALNPLELAEAVRRLVVHGWTDKEIGTGIGKSPAYVGKLKKLMDAPKKFQNLIRNNEISPTFAIEIVGKGGVDDFMEKHESGTFGKVEQGKKIKKKDLNKDKVDSWKFFKKFSATIDESRMNKAQKEAYEFMLSISLNTATAQDYQKFFNQE